MDCMQSIINIIIGIILSILITIIYYKIKGDI